MNSKDMLNALRDKRIVMPKLFSYTEVQKLIEEQTKEMNEDIKFVDSFIQHIHHKENYFDEAVKWRDIKKKYARESVTNDGR